VEGLGAEDRIAKRGRGKRHDYYLIRGRRDAGGRYSQIREWSITEAERTILKGARKKGGSKLAVHPRNFVWRVAKLGGDDGGKAHREVNWSSPLWPNKAVGGVAITVPFLQREKKRKGKNAICGSSVTPSEKSGPAAIGKRKRETLHERPAKNYWSRARSGPGRSFCLWKARVQ